MKIVIDTNIIFSMLILKNSRLRDAFFEKKVKWYAPNFVLVEIFKRKEKLLKHSHLVALALELNASIWTGDKKLKDGLIHKGFDNFFVPL